MQQVCIDHFLKKTEIDISTNKKAMRRLRAECEKAKRALSASNKTQIEVDALANNEDFTYNFTRTKLETLCNPLFEQCMDTVKEVIKDAKLTAKEIDDVLLVGGSTRIPKIQQLVEEFFGKKPNINLNPDEAVARGACIFAAILTNKTGSGLENFVIEDVTAMSFGTDIQDGKVLKIIEKNTKIPVTKSSSFSNIADELHNMSVKIFEGESENQNECREVGDTVLQNIPKAPVGSLEIEVIFSIDENGTLTVTAK